jgi:HK97 gp10 family phage protein
MIELKLEGVFLLKSRLDSLTKKVQKKIVRKAVRESLKPILKSAKTNAKALSRGGGSGMAKLIAKNIKEKAYKKQKRGQYAMYVGIETAKGAAKKSSGSAKGFYKFMEKSIETMSFVYITKSGRRYYIPTAIEYGHAFPGRGGRKNAPKDVAARPFMRPAIDTNKQKAAKIFTDVMGAGIEREARSVG